MLIRAALLAPFSVTGFTGLWVSASSGAFARVVTQIVFSWLMLELTGSPFMVGVVSAARMVPGFLLGIPAGALADWVDRRAMVMAVNAASVVLLLGLVPLVVLGLLPPLALVLVSALYGTLDTLRMAATQAYAYDLVRSSRATSGMALTNLGVQLLSTVGGLAGGYTLDHYGTAATFALVSGALLAAVLGPMLDGKPVQPSSPGPLSQSNDTLTPTLSQREREPVASPVPPQRERGSLGDAPHHPSPITHHPSPGTQLPAPAKKARPDFGRAASLLLRNRMIATVALGVILAEILGFASQVLLPTFAHDVFHTGASGLGTMLAVRSGGGTVGLLLLAWIGAEGKSGLTFVTGATLLGVMLLLFGMAPEYGLALVFLALAGLCSSIMDTLGQTLMQRNAGETERGAAMGLWVFSVGFGPVGHLTLGAAAQAYGAPLTQMVSGAVLAVIGLLLGLNRPLRRAR